MISDGCLYAYRKVLVKGVCENLLPSAQSVRLWRPGPTVATPGTGNRHIDLCCYLIPGQAWSRSSRICCVDVGWVRGPAATHGDAGMAKLMTHGGPGNAQLGTDLAQRPTLGIQVGCTLNVHRVTVSAEPRLTAPTSSVPCRV
jgi:hypothetical protein